MKRGIPARIYRPNLPAPLPVVLNFHGGGWVMGTIDMDDRRCHHLAMNAGVAVISIDYCLAPEHPFPQPLEECYAATVWTFLNQDPANNPAGLTRKEQLLQTLVTVKRIDSLPSADKIDRLTSQPSELLRLSIDDLEDRAAMLQDVRAACT